MPPLHRGCHLAGCVLDSQLWAEKSSCSVLPHGVSKHQQLNFGWLQEMPPSWAPELGAVPVGSCLEWEKPSVFLEGMATTCAGQEPLAMTQARLPSEGTKATT